MPIDHCLCRESTKAGQPVASVVQRRSKQEGAGSKLHSTGIGACELLPNFDVYTTVVVVL